MVMDPRCSPAVSVDDHLRVLAHEADREVVAYLMDSRDQSVPISDLIAVLQSNPRVDDDAAVRLHHVILPRLEAIGVITYDADTHMVTYVGHPDVESLVQGPVGFE